MKNTQYSVWSVEICNLVYWLSPELSLVHLSACVNADDRAVVRRRGLTLRSRGPTGGDGRDWQASSREEGPPGCRGGWCAWEVTPLLTSKKQVTSSSGLDSRPSRSRFQQTTDTACSNKIFCVKLYSLLVAMMNFLRYSCCWTIFLKKINSLTACLDLSKYFEGSKIYFL